MLGTHRLEIQILKVLYIFSIKLIVNSNNLFLLLRIGDNSKINWIFRLESVEKKKKSRNTKLVLFEPYCRIKLTLPTLMCRLLFQERGKKRKILSPTKTT